MSNTADVFHPRWSELDLDSDARPLPTAIVCFTAALLSCFITGFVFGVSNNQFHLPIMERLYDEPQFAHDAFIQSLRYFSSGVWLFLQFLPKFADGGYTLFLVLFFVSRLLSFVGFLCCASLLGIVTLRERLVLCAIICFTTLLDGNSVAGHGGLFVTFFSHSEIANGTILLAIFFAAKGRFTAASICTGVTFFINAFMGAWLFAPLLFIAVLLLRNKEISKEALIPQIALGAICFAAFAAPILYNAVSNPELHAVIDFDFIAFIREWYGGHYLIDANSTIDILLLVGIGALGWMSFKTLDGNAAAFRAAFLGMVAVYLIGVVAPSVAFNTVIFKLHLLRTSAVIQLLTALGVGSLATKWLCSEDRKQSALSGPLLLFCLCASKILLPLGGVVIARASGGPSRQGYIALRPVLVALSIAMVFWQYLQRAELNRELTAAVSDWQAVGTWARNTTPPESMFLILTANTDSLASMSEADAQRTLKLTTAAAAFEAAAHRRVWVDFLTGGMAVHQPSYYAEWHSRSSSVVKLRTLSEKLKYAQNNGIDYVVEDCMLFDESGVTPGFRSGGVCAIAVKATNS